MSEQIEKNDSPEVIDLKSIYNNLANILEDVPIFTREDLCYAISCEQQEGHLSVRNIDKFVDYFINFNISLGALEPGVVDGELTYFYV